MTFLERDEEWYAQSRDMPNPAFCKTVLYGSVDELKRDHAQAVAQADVVVVGSYVREGVAVSDWVRETASGVVAFYDIDTPVTLAKLARGDYEYLEPRQIENFDLYLSFSGGKALEVLADEYRSPCPRPLYCSVDAALYYPEPVEPEWDLGYLGTYSDDRQPGVTELLIVPAQFLPGKKFIVAGPQYPEGIEWPVNVQRINHLPPDKHRQFYNSQKFTLNITRDDMKRMGHSPSVRLFEAAACGVPVISDEWPGLSELFEPAEEILIAHQASDVGSMLVNLRQAERDRVGKNARERVLAAHTSDHRARELVSYVEELKGTAAPVRDPEFALER